MKCENCPAGWEDRSYEGECGDFGCLIYGHEICLDNCRLSEAEINKRLKQWEDYTAGRIERPKWVANKFIREMDASWWFGHSLGIFLPGYPPPKMRNGCHESIYSSKFSLFLQPIFGMQFDSSFTFSLQLALQINICPAKCRQVVFGPGAK